MKDAYAHYLVEQDPSSDSDASATRPTAIDSEDSSDSDAFCADSESDCPCPRKAAGKKRTRRASRRISEGEREGDKILELDVDPKRAALDVVMKNGNLVAKILPVKARRATKGSSTRLSGKTKGPKQHLILRRAGLSDMSRIIGS